MNTNTLLAEHPSDIDLPYGDTSQINDYDTDQQYETIISQSNQEPEKQQSRASIKGFRLLCISCALTSAFSVKDMLKVLPNNQQDGLLYKKIEMQATTPPTYFITIVLILHLMPFLIRRYQMEYKLFYFFSVLPILPCLIYLILSSFLTSQESVVKNLQFIGYIILYQIMNLLQIYSSVQAYVFAIGYMIDLIDQQGINSAGYLIVFFTLPQSLIRAIMLGLAKAYSDNMYVQIRVACILALLGIFIAYFVRPFQQPARTEGYDKFQVYKILQNKQFWPLLAVLATYYIEYNFAVTINLNKETHQEAEYNFYKLEAIVFNIFIMPFLILIAYFNSKNKINLDFSVIVCLILNLAVNLLQAFLLLQFKNADKGKIQTAYLVTDAAEGAIYGILQMVTLLMTITRCRGEIEIWALGVAIYYFFYMLSSMVSFEINVGIAMFCQFALLIILTYFSRSQDVHKKYYESLYLIQQTIGQIQISKSQFQARYLFIKVLSEGQQGLVHQYQDQHHQKYVAVKIVQTQKKEDYEEIRREVEIMRSLSGFKNIVQVHQYVLNEDDEHNFQIYIVMDVADGTLEDEIKLRKGITKKTSEDSQKVPKKHKLSQRNFFTNEEIRNMVKQLINACARVESEKGMQHRDLKPSNILKIKGEWYISDFGTSKIIEPSAETQPGNERAHLTSNSIKGSPAYMSPQLRYVWERYHRRQTVMAASEYLDVGEMSVSLPVLLDYFKSDVFSLGITLLEACTLRSIHLMNMHQEKLNKAVDDLKNQKYVKCDQDIIHIIEQMLTWEEEYRPKFSEIQLN